MNIFYVLEETLGNSDLTNKPHMVFNCDEASLALNKSSRKVLVPRNSKHCHTIATASSQHVSSVSWIRGQEKYESSAKLAWIGHTRNAPHMMAKMSSCETSALRINRVISLRILFSLNPIQYR